VNQDSPMNSNGDHNSDPTFPRGGSMHRNRARMSRLNYRKIDSGGSLSFRRTLLSYLHVMPHSRVYKAEGAPLQNDRTHYLAIHPILCTLGARELSCNPPRKALSPGHRVLRISKRPEPVNHCPLFLVHLARTIELQSITPSYS
jgi:hypothetical protein